MFEVQVKAGNDPSSYSICEPHMCIHVHHHDPFSSKGQGIFCPETHPIQGKYLCVDQMPFGMAAEMTSMSINKTNKLLIIIEVSSKMSDALGEPQTP